MRNDKRAFTSFSNRLTLEVFETKLASLPLPKRDDFYNAVNLYQQALKCARCNRGVAMLLLCSCAESMQLAEKPRDRFKKFFMDYCPSNLKNPPIKYFLDEKPSTYNDASFEEALVYIYAKFRCLYTHEGIDYSELPKGLSGYWIIDELKENKDKHFVINIRKIPNWFKKITYESLYNFLCKSASITKEV